MATTTRPRTPSMRRTTPRPRPARPTRAQRTQRSTTSGFHPSIPRRRSKPKPSGLKGMISKAVPSAMGAKATTKTASSAKKPAGMALLAGAAGLAYKNREKLGGMLGRNKSDDQAQPHLHDEPYATPATANPPHPSSPAL